MRKVRILEKFAKKMKILKCAEFCEKVLKVRNLRKSAKMRKYENGPNFIKISLDFIRVFAFGAFFVDFPEIMSILNIFTKIQ